MILFVNRKDSFAPNLKLKLQEALKKAHLESKNNCNNGNFQLVDFEIHNHSKKESLNWNYDFEKLIEIINCHKFFGIVLSSGPGFPGENKAIFEFLNFVKTEKPKIPLLGVCLGFQELLSFFGFTVEKIKTPFFHGQQKKFSHIKSDILASHWNNFDAVFFNSLGHFLNSIEKDTFESCFKATWKNAVLDTYGMTCFAEHVTLPWLGTQFHPESVATPQGFEIIDAFIATCLKESLH